MIDTDAANDPVWHPVGLAWRYRDRKGYSIELGALPVGGRLSMRVRIPD